MLTSEQIDELNTIGGHLMTPITDWLLDDIVRRIKEAGSFTSTAEYQVWRLKQLGMKKGEINKELRRRLKMTQAQLNDLITESAKAGYLQDITRLNAQALPFEKNGFLQRLISVTRELAGKDLRNATQTLGWVNPFGKTVGLTEAYQSCCDFAFMQVSSGAADYNTAVKAAVRNLVDKGVQTIDYDSGRSVSVEAAVRRSVLGGIGLMQEKISDENYKKLGATGWEISAHMASAPDHEPIQGRQYTNEEYRELNSKLARRIGTLNCKHIAFPIIYGVTRPVYSAEHLEEMKRQNAKGITYRGKHYTMYEATQHQRALERSIRRQKRAVTASEASGDKDALLADKIRLTHLKQEYNSFSKASGLPAQYARFETGENISATLIKSEVQQMLDNLSGKDILYDEKIIKGIGAKSASYPIVYYPETDIQVEFVPNSRPAYPPDHTMAGNGSKTKRKIDDIDRLVETYNCDAERWQKEKARYQVYDEYGNIQTVELHWYKHPDIGDVEHKVKTKGGCVYVEDWE